MSELVFNLVCFLASIMDAARGLRLERVEVPSLVELGSRDFVTLDCDYKLEGEEVAEVRWYFNEETLPFYWWSPPRAPHTRGPLAAHIDANYTVSEDWRVSRRALRLRALQVALGGRYSCEVAAGEQRARVSTHMLVYSGEHELQVRSRLVPPGGSAPPGSSTSPGDSDPLIDSAPALGPGADSPLVEVVCTVRSVYPIPDLILYHNGRVIEQQWMRAWTEGEGLLSAEARALQPPGAPLTAGDAPPDKFACRLTLPAAHYEAVAYTTFDYQAENQTSSGHKVFEIAYVWLTTVSTVALLCT